MQRQEKSVTYEDLSSSLDRLARENHSIIAGQIQRTDSKGQVVFTYDIFGEENFLLELKKRRKNWSQRKPANELLCIIR